uniref:Uncharacterized protein n=1 Tax=Romanomermis culicivorax TaxID=13658 RepID=A0A915JVA9_ROMCU
MAAMVASVRGRWRLMFIVAVVAIFLVVAVVVITKGVTGIVMAIKANGARVVIATVVLLLGRRDDEV